MPRYPSDRLDKQRYHQHRRGAVETFRANHRVQRPRWHRLGAQGIEAPRASSRRNVKAARKDRDGPLTGAWSDEEKIHTAVIRDKPSAARAIDAEQTWPALDADRSVT